MQLTLVHFRAFDKPHEKIFIDKTPEEIHIVLSGMCFTYELTAIIHATDGIHYPHKYINQYNKNKTHD